MIEGPFLYEGEEYQSLLALQVRCASLYHQDRDRWWLYHREVGELPDRQFLGFVVETGPNGTDVVLQPVPQTLWLQPMGANLRLSLGPTDGVTFNSNYCFADRAAAWQAALSWDGHGDPDGWIRHIESGRRRPEGDPAREYYRV
jgi:hypothetical protein